MARRGRSSESNKLSRLISRPKVTFEKGMIDVDRDAINGYVSDLNNMEIDNGAVVKRKGSIVMNDNTEADKWLLLEEINISGVNLLLCINAKRECYVVSEAYPEINIKLCKDGFEPIFTTGASEATYHMQFKTGDKFWLLDTGRYYIVVSNTGEAYRIVRDGIVRFSETNRPYTMTTDYDVKNRVERSRLTRDINCFVNIIDATNYECRGAYAGEVSDHRITPIKGDFRFAFMNDSGVISKFSDTVSYPEYAKRVFSSLPLSTAVVNGYDRDGESETGTKYIVKDQDTGKYELVSSFTPDTVEQVDAFMFVSWGDVEDEAGGGADWNTDLMETSHAQPTVANGKIVQSLPEGVYIIIPKLTSSDTTCLGVTEGILKVSNLSDGKHAIASLSAPIESTISANTYDAYTGSRDDFYTEYFGGDLVASGDSLVRNPFATPKPNRTYTASNYNVLSANAYAWQIYKLDVPDSYISESYEKVTHIVNVTRDASTWDPSDSGAANVTLQHRFFGRVYTCSVDVAVSPSSNTSYDLPASGIKITGVTSDTLIKATNKCGNHWSYSKTSLSNELDINGLDTFTLAISQAENSIMIPVDSESLTLVTEEQLKKRRLVVWSNDEIISIAQKGFGQAATYCYNFTYGAIVASTVYGNQNYAPNGMDVQFDGGAHLTSPVVKINSPVTWTKNKSITSFPYDIPSFQELITAAKSIVFNAGKVFVVQENKLWIGEDGLVLTNPITVGSTIEHMTGLYDGVLLFTEKGIVRVNGKGQQFQSATRRAKKLVGSGDKVYFVDDKGMVVRGRLVFSENNVPLVQYDVVSEAITNIEFGDDPEMTVFDDMLYVSDGENVYRFNDKLSIWDKHVEYGKKIRKLSHYNGKLVTFIYDDPDRFNSFYISPTTGGGGA